MWLLKGLFEDEGDLKEYNKGGKWCTNEGNDG